MTKEQSHGPAGHGNHLLKITIDGTPFEWGRQYITGEELRKLAGLPHHSPLFLYIADPWEDEVIHNETKVDLARPSVEHFASNERDKAVTIIINGSPVRWEKNKINFKEVIEKAFGQYIDNPNLVYTVGYEDGPKQNPEGEMHKGDSLFVKQKMIFHATATDKS